MIILLLGSGAREHALAWKISQSPQCELLYIAPGNAGTAQCGRNVNISLTNFEHLGEFCINSVVDMVVVGPEDPLVNGLADFFENNEKFSGIPVIGPTKTAAQLEGSKAFAKSFMVRNNVTTPAYREFSEENSAEAKKYICQQQLPVVLKADGLAAGKGVLICNTYDEALVEFDLMLHGKFGNAGSKIIIEQYLTGIELTVIILTDGDNYLILPPTKDYKKIGEGDTGLNTGGMGAISPPLFADELFIKKVERNIIQPTLKGLQKENIHYRGFLYFGLFSVTDNGENEPYLVEYNVRLGDPEAEVILPRIKNDIIDLFKAVAENKLNEQSILINDQACATIILASHGYPGEYETGKIITGLENIENAMIFYAAVKTDENDNLITAGGRVLAVTSYGNTVDDALINCYINAGRIYYESRYFRSDIGWDMH